MKKLKIENLKTVTFSIDEVCTLYFYEDHVFRAVNKAYESDVKKMFDSGMMKELINQGLFVNTWISDVEIEGYDLVLEHKKVEYWNYPYEWSFSMLKDAAKVVLDVNIIANKYGFELYDVHAENVVYDMNTPLYVDLGSLSKIDPANGKCWSGYLNFYNSFYMPLYLYEKGFSDLPQTLYLYNGVFSPRDNFLLRYRYLNLFGSKITSLLYKLYDNSRRLSVGRHFRVMEKFGKHRRIKIILALKKYFQDFFTVNKAYRLINSIKKSSFESYWKDYHSGMEPENEKRFLRIISLIKSKLSDATILIELASNQGKFAAYILGNTQIKKIIATDYDKNALNQLYLSNKGNKNFLPLVYDFVRPNGKRVHQKIEERIQGDAVLALAVTHHLLLTQGVSLTRIFEILGSLTHKYVVVEFMPLGLYFGDMDNIPPVPKYYTLEWFKDEFSQYFEHIFDEEVEINRHLFIGKVKNC